MIIYTTGGAFRHGEMVRCIIGASGHIYLKLFQRWANVAGIYTTLIQPRPGRQLLYSSTKSKQQ